MTGSIALDVVIGLVFIYSLYSLLTTTVTEIVATGLRLRSGFLEKGIRRMLDDGSRTRIFSDKFYEQPLVKYLGSGSLFGFIKKPSYLSAQNFSKALFEVLKEHGGALLITQNVTDSPVIDRIRAATKQDPTNTLSKSETIKFIRSLLEDSQNDLDKFKTYLEKWYDDTMERVTSWYKKWIQVVTFIIGFMIAYIFNVDTLKIIEKLSNDPKARERFVVMAEKFANDKDTMKQVYGDSATRQNTFEQLRKQALESNNVLSIEEKPASKTRFWGWLITAIALSLGTPFWFDLLNKLVKLRSSVQAASPSQQESPNEKVVAVKRVG